MALVINALFTVSLEAFGYFSRKRAMAPETIGVDMEVPLFTV